MREGEREAVLILRYLKEINIYNVSLNTCIEKAYFFVTHNPNDPISIELNQLINNICIGLDRQLQNIPMISYNPVVSERFKRLNFYACIPFKCDEQMFIYYLIETFRGLKHINDHRTIDILYNLTSGGIISNNTRDNIISIAKNNVSNGFISIFIPPAQYNNNYHSFTIYREAAKKCGVTWDIQHPDKPSQVDRSIIGYAGERAYAQEQDAKFQLNPKENYSIHISKNIGDNVSLDFANCNLVTGQAQFEEIKATVQDELKPVVFLTENESYVFDAILEEENNCTYGIRKYQLSRDLKSVIAYHDYIIYARDNVVLTDQNGNALTTDFDIRRSLGDNKSEPILTRTRCNGSFAYYNLHK